MPLNDTSFISRARREAIASLHQSKISTRQGTDEFTLPCHRSSIERAVRFYHAIRDDLAEHEAIVPFSGEHEHGGSNVTEASLNGFSSNRITDRIREDPLISALAPASSAWAYD